MRPWAFAVKHWQFTLLAFGFAVALGVASWNSIPRSEDPVFPFPNVTIIAVLPGSDPVDVERLVVDPIEDAINELDDVKKIESQSHDGVGTIQVEFDWGVDPGKKYDEVVREVNALRPKLPQELASLEIRKASAGLVNIVQVALVSESASYRDLESRAKTLRDRLEAVPGVRKSETWAYPDSEVSVAVDLERLSHSWRVPRCGHRRDSREQRGHPRRRRGRR